MGIPTLISTATETNAASIDITSGIDSTYDEYMFVCTDIGPATDGEHFSFQVNAASASGFNETIMSSVFIAQHTESAGDAQVAISAGNDQALGTAYQNLTLSQGNGADESAAGILYLFSPSNTTYIKPFWTRFSNYGASNYAIDYYTGGYFNITAAIDEISFKMTSGNFDGVIQMYGIS